MANQTRDAIVRLMARDSGLTISQCRAAEKSFENVIKKLMADGETVQLQGFLKMETRTKGGYEITHPKTGEPVRTAVRNQIVFSVGDAFQRAINPNRTSKK